MTTLSRWQPARPGQTSRRTPADSAVFRVSSGEGGGVSAKPDHPRWGLWLVLGATLFALLLNAMAHWDHLGITTTAEKATVADGQ